MKWFLRLGVLCLMSGIINTAMAYDTDDSAVDDIVEFPEFFVRDMQKLDDGYTESLGADFNSGHLMDYTSPEFQNLKDDVIAEYPEIKNELHNKPEYAHPEIIRGFLSRRIYEDLKNKYLSDIEKRAKETGRKLKTKKSNDRWKVKKLKYNRTTECKYIWLDRGDLDSKKCQWNLEKRTACNYPQGFEDYSIQHCITKTDDRERGLDGWHLETLTIIQDIPDKNQSLYIEIYLDQRLHKNQDKQIEFYEYSINFGGQVSDYDKWYAYQNQHVEDLRNGYYVRCTDSDNHGKSGIEICEWKKDDTRTWKSDSIMPDTRVLDITKEL